MAIRLTIEGINVECDTPQEVAALIRVAREKLPAGGTITCTVPKPQPARAPMSPAVKSDAGLFKPTESAEVSTRSFNGSHLGVLTALKEAFPSGASSDHLAARIGKTRRSIPIVLVSLQTFARKRNLRFRDLIVREKPPRGAKGSSYRLTERGLKEFFR